MSGDELAIKVSIDGLGVAVSAFADREGNVAVLLSTDAWVASASLAPEAARMVAARLLDAAADAQAQAAGPAPAPGSGSGVAGA